MTELSPRMPRWLKFLVTFICLAVVVAVLWQLLPRGSFPSDLDRVGQGRPALVMLREVQIVGGEQVIELMLEVHPDYEERVEFLVVQTGVPDGRAFAEEYNLRDGSLVLFDAGGEVIDIMGRPGSTQELRGFIDRGLP